MAKKRKQREPGPPELWGVFNSTYFQFDGHDETESKKRLQDHPELYANVLKMCADYFTELERRTPHA